MPGYGACGVHTGIASSEASDHAYTVGGCTHSYYMCQASGHEWGTAPCGDATHVGYLCQIVASDQEWVYEICPSMHAYYECDGSDHSLQASCSETNANGDSCTVTSFYACQTHTHAYPPLPTVACWASSWSGCTAQVSSGTAHRVDSCTSCSSTYWTCSSDHVALHETQRTCRRSGCGQTFIRCSKPTCLADSDRKCWAVNTD